MARHYARLAARGKFMENQTQENKPVCTPDKRNADDCKCNLNGANCINSHFTLSVIAVIISCFTCFFTIPLAIAGMILSLRAQDLARTNRPDEARRVAWWAGLFGWLTVGIAVVPLVLVLFFGGTLLALLTAILASA